MEVVKVIRCKECGGLLELDKNHLSQKRHLECALNKSKKNNRDYYSNYVKKS